MKQQILSFIQHQQAIEAHRINEAIKHTDHKVAEGFVGSGERRSVRQLASTIQNDTETRMFLWCFEATC